MKSRYLTFAGGLFTGILLTAGTLWITLPQAMIRVHNSPLGFEQTVTTIRDSITAHGWVQPKVYNIQKSLDKAGLQGHQPDQGAVTLPAGIRLRNPQRR